MPRAPKYVIRLNANGQMYIPPKLGYHRLRLQECGNALLIRLVTGYEEPREKRSPYLNIGARLARKYVPPSKPSIKIYFSRAGTELRALVLRAPRA